VTDAALTDAAAPAGGQIPVHMHEVGVALQTAILQLGVEAVEAEIGNGGGGLGTVKEGKIGYRQRGDGLQHFFGGVVLNPDNRVDADPGGIEGAGFREAQGLAVGYAQGLSREARQHITHGTVKIPFAVVAPGRIEINVRFHQHHVQYQPGTRDVVQGRDVHVHGHIVADEVGGDDEVEQRGDGVVVAHRTLQGVVIGGFRIHSVGA